MTTQNAGKQAAERLAGPAAIDPEEAERLASLIRPAWEMDGPDLDEGQLAAPAVVAAAPEADAQAAQFDKLAERFSLPDRLLDGGVDSSATATASGNFAPPRDTVIDGVPTVGVGDEVARSSVSSAIAQGIAIVDSGVARPLVDVGSEAAPAQPAGPNHPSAGMPAPKRPGPTKLGLGDDVSEGLAIVDAGASASQPPRSHQPKSGGTLRMDPAAADAARREALARPPSAPPADVLVPPQRAGYSASGDDPIEIPVQKGSKTVLFVLAGVVVVGGIIGGVLAFGGSGSTTKKSDAKTTTAETARTDKTSAESTKTAVLTASSASLPPPVPTETAAASASSAPSSASASASASASEVVSAEPSAKPAKSTKPAASSKPTSTATSKPTSTATTKPTGTGIIRDTPF